MMLVAASLSHVAETRVMSSSRLEPPSPGGPCPSATTLVLFHPLLQQVLSRLDLLGRPCYRDDTVGGAGCRLIDGDAGLAVHADLTDPLAAWTNDCAGQVIRDCHLSCVPWPTVISRLLEVEGRRRRPGGAPKGLHIRGLPAEDLARRTCRTSEPSESSL